MARLKWSGSLEAVRQADEAYSKLKPRKKRRTKSRVHKKQQLEIDKRAKKWLHRRGVRSQARYHEYLASKKWQARRKQFIDDARGRCEDCGVARSLTVHHLHYKSLGRERREDVRVLCWSCHKTYHADKELDREMDAAMSKQ